MLPSADMPAAEGESHLAARAVLRPELARRLGVLPLAADEQLLTLASFEPSAQTLAAVRAVSGKQVELVRATREEVRRGQDRLFGPPPIVRRPRTAAPSAAPPADARALRQLAEREALEIAPLVNLDSEIGLAAARLLGEPLSRRLGVLALATENGSVRVATSKPLGTLALRTIAAVTGLRPQPVLATPVRIEAGIAAAFAVPAEVRPRTPIGAVAPGRRRLGEILLEARVLDTAALEAALAVQARTGDQLGRILASAGTVSAEAVAKGLAQQLGVAYIDSPLPVDAAAGALLPTQVCLTYRVVPLAVVDGELVVATSDPLDLGTRRALAEATGTPVDVVVASEASIETALDDLFSEHLLEESTRKLARTRPELSAHRILSERQKAVLIAVALLLLLGLAFVRVPTLVTVAVMLMVFYFATAAYKTALIVRSLRDNSNQAVAAPQQLDERELPVYTILVPLYREAVVLPGLVRAIDSLDYPKAKLDVKLLLEEDDAETVEAVRALELGPHFHVLVVPDSLPKTKPKACNYGLLRARGEYVVIFDAEDRPEPDQLKKAVLAFRAGSQDVVCVQARLNYWNREQNVLTRWFTSEYSQWFDLFLPGLDSTEAPIPLGGTSNHFATETLRELDGWDPFNVTEDADLGMRLARAGYRTSMIDSTTYEEANSQLGNWIRQRSRWTKGYVLTWLVHMRHPIRLWRELGARNWFSFHLVFGGTPLTLLLNPISWGLTLLWLFTEAKLIQQMFPGPVFYIGATNLLISNFLFIYLNIAGLLRRGYDDLVKYALLSPLYWILMSVGAWKGLLQLFTRPSYWEKTVHGLTELPE